VADNQLVINNKSILVVDKTEPRECLFYWLL